jgi:hypothetical protein
MYGKSPYIYLPMLPRSSRRSGCFCLRTAFVMGRSLTGSSLKPYTHSVPATRVLTSGFAMAGNSSRRASTCEYTQLDTGCSPSINLTRRKLLH